MPIRSTLCPSWRGQQKVEVFPIRINLHLPIWAWQRNSQDPAYICPYYQPLPCVPNLENASLVGLRRPIKVSHGSWRVRTSAKMHLENKRQTFPTQHNVHRPWAFAQNPNFFLSRLQKSPPTGLLPKSPTFPYLCRQTARTTGFLPKNPTFAYLPSGQQNPQDFCPKDPTLFADIGNTPSVCPKYPTVPCLHM